MRKKVKDNPSYPLQNNIHSHTPRFCGFTILQRSFGYAQYTQQAQLFKLKVCASFLTILGGERVRVKE